MFPDKLLTSLLGEQISERYGQTDETIALICRGESRFFKPHIRELTLVPKTEVNHIPSNFLAKGTK